MGDSENLNNPANIFQIFDARGILEEQACETSLEVSWTISEFLSSWPRKAVSSPSFGTGSHKFYLLMEPTDPDFKRSFSLFLYKFDEKISVKVYIYFARCSAVVEDTSYTDESPQRTKLRPWNLNICRVENLKQLYERIGILTSCSIKFTYDIDASFKNYFLSNDEVTIFCKLCISFDEVKHCGNTAQQRIPEMCQVRRLNEISGSLNSLLENEKLSDLTLCAEGTEFKVHRAILGARSPVFCAMLEHNSMENKESRVVIEDVSSEVVALLLRYIYTGELKNLEYNVTLDLFVAADKYALLGLKSECSKFLVRNLTRSNLTRELVFDTLMKADQHEDMILKEAAINFMRDYVHDMMLTEEWLTFMKVHTKLANDIFLSVLKSGDVLVSD